jgi:hypothetical protein
MKTIFAAVAAVAVIGAALPAAAQGFDRGYDRGFDRGFDRSYDRGFDGDLNRGGRFEQNDSRRIEMRIERGVRDGSLTRWEARGLRRQLDDVRRMERAFAWDGFVDRREARELDDRYQRLTFRLRAERHDGDSRYGQGYRR